MSEQERDDALVAVQTKNVLLTAANTELLRQLRVAERKAAALDWLAARHRYFDLDRVNGWWVYAEDDREITGRTLLVCLEQARHAEQEKNEDDNAE